MLPVIAAHAAPRRRRSARTIREESGPGLSARKCTPATRRNCSSVLTLVLARCAKACRAGRSLDVWSRGVLEKMASARAYMRGLAQQGIAAALQQAAALSAENLPAQPPRVRAMRCGSGAGPKSPVPAPPRPAHLQQPAARAALTCAPAQGYKPAAWCHAAYWSAFATRRDSTPPPSSGTAWTQTWGS